MANSVAEPRVIILLRILGGLDKGAKPDRWKVQKTTFLSEKKMKEECIGGLDYRFVKDQHGPLAAGIYDDLDVLIRSGFVTRDEEPVLTEEGKEFVESLKELYDLNSKSIAPVDEVIKLVENKSGKDLRQLTHEMTVEVNGEEVKIDKLPRNTQILNPIPVGHCKSQFIIPSDWKETIQIWSDKTNREALKGTFSKVSRSDFVF